MRPAISWHSWVCFLLLVQVDIIDLFVTRLVVVLLSLCVCVCASCSSGTSISSSVVRISVVIRLVPSFLFVLFFSGDFRCALALAFYRDLPALLWF